MNCRIKVSISYCRLKRTPYIIELGHFTAYVRTNLLYARTQRFARNAAYTAVPPSESPLRFADRKSESVIVGYYTSAEVPFSRRKQPSTPFVKPSVRRIHIAHGRCERGIPKGGQHPWHTTLVQSLVCYTLPEVYTFLKCKKPHANTLTVRTWDLMLPRPSRVLRNQS